jgi:hypothetical protein
MLVEITALQIRDANTEKEQRLRDYDETIEWDTCSTAKDVYRAAKKEYGRCSGKVYVDNPDGVTRHVGWVFIKRCKFSDCSEYYLQETWITPLLSKKTNVVREYAI